LDQRPFTFGADIPDALVLMTTLHVPKIIVTKDDE